MAGKCMIILLTVLLTAAYACADDADNNKILRLLTKERSLGKVHPGIMQETITLSPNKRRIAYSAFKLNGKAVAVLDGVESEEYDDVDNFVFSSNSERFAYAATSDYVWFLVLDKVKQKAYERIGYRTIKFSPDNRRLCYMVWEPTKNQQFVVVDGVEQERYVGIFVDHPIFNSNSKKVVYGARKGEKSVIVVNGKEDLPYDAIAGLVLSPDGEHWAYAAQKGKEWLVVVDGRESGEKYDGVYEDCIVFSPDGKRFSYAAIKNGKGFVIVDGVKGKPYDVIDNGSIVFSRDSKRFAYRAVRNKKQFYVIDAKECKAYYGVGGGGTFLFSPDSKHTAYMVLENNKEFVVLDGREGKKYDEISPPVFNPVDNTLAYSARQNNEWFVVNNGKEGEKYDITGIPVFSPDGKHIAYRVQRAQKQIVITDMKEGNEHDEIFQSSLMFTFDSQHLVYRALKGEKECVVVDGTESVSYDIIFQTGEFVFNASDSFNFIASRDDEFFVVDIQIAEN